MINEIIKAIVGKLKKLFPDKKICADKMTENSDGKIYIIVNSPSQTKELAGIRKRNISFDISYFCTENDKMDYHDWIDIMYDNFEYIKTKDMIFTAHNLHADNFDGIYHFLFDLDYRVLRKKYDAKMENLKQKGDLKNG